MQLAPSSKNVMPIKEYRRSERNMLSYVVHGWFLLCSSSLVTLLEIRDDHLIPQSLAPNDVFRLPERIRSKQRPDRKILPTGPKSQRSNLDEATILLNTTQKSGVLSYLRAPALNKTLKKSQKFASSLFFPSSRKKDIVLPEADTMENMVKSGKIRQIPRSLDQLICRKVLPCSSQQLNAPEESVWTRCPVRRMRRTQRSQRGPLWIKAGLNGLKGLSMLV